MRLFLYAQRRLSLKAKLFLQCRGEVGRGHWKWIECEISGALRCMSVRFSCQKVTVDNWRTGDPWYRAQRAYRWIGHYINHQVRKWAGGWLSELLFRNSGREVVILANRRQTVIVCPLNISLELTGELTRQTCLECGLSRLDWWSKLAFAAEIQEADLALKRKRLGLGYKVTYMRHEVW